MYPRNLIIAGRAVPNFVVSKELPLPSTERSGRMVGMDAVVFDLDGVIVDSEPVWERVRRRYVDTHGGTWRPDSQRRLMGMSTAEWSAYLSVELGVHRAPEQVATEVVEEMSRAYTARIPLIAGADQVVRRLAERWPLGLASSSPARLIGTALDATGLTGLFRVTISTEETARGKPAPDVYLAVAKRLGIPAGRCAAVEDSSNGVRSAAAAGMRVVAVPHASYPLDAEAERLVAMVLPDITTLTPAVIAGASSTAPVDARADAGKEPAGRSPRIRELAWGRMVVDGLGEGKDFKLHPGGGRQWDWSEAGTRHDPGILPADVEELLTAGATSVVLSQGMDGRLQVAPETVRFLQDRAVGMHMARTEEAVRRYNDLADRGPVGGLFHSTC